MIDMKRPLKIIY